MGMAGIVKISDVPEMVLCQICPDPGRCCRSLRLYKENDDELTFWRESWQEDVAAKLRTAGLPFVPERVVETYKVDDATDEDFGREYVTLRFRCPMLSPSGRCSIYASRPELCRNYRPNEDALCAFCQGSDSQ